jgi:hypothetical protein
VIPDVVRNLAVNTGDFYANVCFSEPFLKRECNNNNIKVGYGTIIAEMNYGMHVGNPMKVDWIEGGIFLRKRKVAEEIDRDDVTGVP